MHPLPGAQRLHCTTTAQTLKHTVKTTQEEPETSQNTSAPLNAMASINRPAPHVDEPLDGWMCAAAPDPRAPWKYSGTDAHAMQRHRMGSGWCMRAQVFESLAAEGFQLTAARVPLSRERTPEAADLDTLLAQHRPPPPGAALKILLTKPLAGNGFWLQQLALRSRRSPVEGFYSAVCRIAARRTPAWGLHRASAGRQQHSWNVNETTSCVPEQARGRCT